MERNSEENTAQKTEHSPRRGAEEQNTPGGQQTIAQCFQRSAKLKTET